MTCLSIAFKSSSPLTFILITPFWGVQTGTPLFYTITPKLTYFGGGGTRQETVVALPAASTAVIKASPKSVIWATIAPA